MTDNIEEGIFYDDDSGSSAKGRVTLREPPKLADAPATDYWKKHNEGRFILNHFHQHGTTQEKFQAAKELKINDRKMNFWEKHPNFDHKEAMQHTEKLKKQWGGFKESFDPSTLDEGSADAFMKFRAKAAAANKSDEDKVRDFLAKGGTIKKAPAKPMSNKLSMSRNVVKTQDFDKELRQAASYLKSKAAPVKEGYHMQCSRCGSSLGKASEQAKYVRCGTCGHSNANTDYDYPMPSSSKISFGGSRGGTGRYNGALSNRVSWPHNYKEEVEHMDELDEVSNPNLARLLALRQKAGNSVGDVVKAKNTVVVSQTSGENSKDVKDFLEKGGRITKVAKGKRNYRWPDGNPERIARKGIKEENIDETSQKKLGDYIRTASWEVNPSTSRKTPSEKRVKWYNKAVKKHADNWRNGIKEENIDELSRATLGSYATKSYNQSTDLAVSQSFKDAVDGTGKKKAKDPKDQAKLDRRLKGQKMLTNRNRILKIAGLVKEEGEYGKPLGAKPLSQVIAKPARKVHEYGGNTKDEREIVNRYRDNTVLVPDYNGNGDDVFKAAKIKRAVKPIDPGQDEKNYAKWNGDVPVVEAYTPEEHPSAEIPKGDRDGTKHIVAVHGYDSSALPQRFFLGHGEDAAGRPKLVGLYSDAGKDHPEHKRYNGEVSARVFDTYGAAHDHVSALAAKDEKKPSYSKSGHQYSIHPKRTDDAIKADHEARKHYSAKESAHLADYKNTGELSHLDAARSAAKARLNSDHPIRRAGHSQGSWTNHAHEFNLIGKDRWSGYRDDEK